MSINLGIYDFFAYLLPGFLYLFLLNDLSARIGWISFDIGQLSTQIDISKLGIAILAAYIVGHIFEIFADWFCYRLLTHNDIPQSALENIKRQYPELKIAFKPQDHHILFVLLRARNLSFTQIIDRFEANSILLKNVSFVAALFSLLQIVDLVKSFNSRSLLLLFTAIFICWLSFQASKLYHTWVFTDIFQASLDYGKNIEEVIGWNKPG